MTNFFIFRENFVYRFAQLFFCKNNAQFSEIQIDKAELRRNLRFLRDFGASRWRWIWEHGRSITKRGIMEAIIHESGGSLIRNFTNQIRNCRIFAVAPDFNFKNSSGRFFLAQQSTYARESYVRMF